MTADLSNKILAYLNGFPSGLTFAQIYDGVKPDSNPNLSFCRTAAGAVYEMACEGLICCNDLFAEASNGVTREKQVLYKITHLGKMRVYGLSSTSNILDVAEGSPAPNLEGLSSFGNGGGENAPALSLPPSTIESVIAAVNKVAVLNPDLCDCGRYVTKKCACGKETCSVHWYDSDGNHTIDLKNGMCGDCVSAIELQTWGESRCGIAGRQ